MTDQTCEDRIDEQLNGRVSDIGATLRKIDKLQNKNKWNKAEEVEQTLWELPLDVETTKVMTVLLSTGGPHDEIRFYLDSDNEVTRIEYVYKDWFDVAYRNVTGDDFDVLVDYFSRYIYVE